MTERHKMHGACAEYVESAAQKCHFVSGSFPRVCKM